MKNLTELKKAVNIINILKLDKSKFVAFTNLFYCAAEKTLTATDLTTSLKIKNVDFGAQNFCVPYAEFKKLTKLKTFPNITGNDEKTIIKINDKRTLELANRTSVQDFPEIKFIHENPQELSVEDQAKLINITKYCSKDKEFTGMALSHVKVTGTEVAATNAHILRTDQLNVNIDVVISQQFIALMKKVNQPGIISHTTEKIQFETEDYIVMEGMKDIKYPNYKAAIPTNNDIKVVFDKTEFMENIQTAKMIKKSELKLKISGSEDSINISFVDDGNTFQAEQQAATKGTDTFSINLNINYLELILNDIEDKTVSMAFNTGHAPIMINGNILIMPMRT